MEERKVTIKVGNRFLTPMGIGRNGLSVHDCFAELVANSFDWNSSKIDSSEVNIEVIIGDDFVQITDNGAGMNFNELDTAINLAEAEDSVREKLNEAERKGMYGMGLKIAALSLGWKFTIRTISHLEPGVEHTFEFDSRHMLDKDSKYLDQLKVITDTVNEESGLAKFKHGTSILIEDLEKNIPEASILRDEIQIRFGPDINNLTETSGLDFKIIFREEGEKDLVRRIDKVDVSRLFEDEVLKLDFENPSKWAKKQNYEYIGVDGKHYQLKGFLQLLEKRSIGPQRYGLNLYYNGQLIERFHKEELLTTRGRGAEKTYGELYLEGCEPDPTKKKFIFNKAIENVRDLISEDLYFYKYLTPATGEAKKKIRKEIDKRKGITDVVETDTEPKQNPTIIQDPDPNDPPTETNFPIGTIEVANRLFIQVTKDGVLEEVMDKQRKVNWESAYIRSKEFNDLMILKVYINPNSLLFKTVKELHSNIRDQNRILSFYKKIAICECIHEKLIDTHNFSPEKAREITDQKVYPQVLKLTNLN